MADEKPSRTLVVILGASVYPKAPKLADGKAFYNSAADFQDYVLGSEGLDLPKRNVEWLFDDSRPPSDLLEDIVTFLQRRSRELEGAGSAIEDLIVYYVGHGLFTRGDQAYSLAVRATNENSEGLSSIRASDLALVIKDNAPFVRRFLILDCCFAASVYREFQSAPLQAARIQLLDELPRKGTALLCSSNSRDPSRAPEGLSHTMFSDALLRALKQGDHRLGAKISVGELGDLVKETLRKQYPQGWVRPEVLSPDQRDGDVARVPIFPNPSHALPEAHTRESGEPEHLGEDRRASEQVEEGPRTGEIPREPPRKAGDDVETQVGAPHWKAVPAIAVAGIGWGVVYLLGALTYHLVSDPFDDAATAVVTFAAGWVVSASSLGFIREYRGRRHALIMGAAWSFCLTAAYPHWIHGGLGVRNLLANGPVAMVAGLLTGLAFGGVDLSLSTCQTLTIAGVMAAAWIAAQELADLRAFAFQHVGETAKILLDGVIGTVAGGGTMTGIAYSLSRGKRSGLQAQTTGTRTRPLWMGRVRILGLPIAIAALGCGFASMVFIMLLRCSTGPDVTLNVWLLRAGAGFFLPAAGAGYLAWQQARMGVGAIQAALFGITWGLSLSLLVFFCTYKTMYAHFGSFVLAWSQVAIQVGALGAVAGLSTGLLLRRMSPALRWKQIGSIATGWMMGFVGYAALLWESLTGYASNSAQFPGAEEMFLWSASLGVLTLGVVFWCLMESTSQSNQLDSFGGR